MIGTRRLAAAAGVLVLATTGYAQQRVAPDHLAIKFVRDSAEYETLAREVYRVAANAVARAAEAVSNARWAVVLDVDETVLDNSAYLLERAAYGLPFESASFTAWALRAQAAAVPGAVDFVAGVRRAGGHIAWITNRSADTKDATRANLRVLGFWKDDDRLCPLDSDDRSKRARRAEVVGGTGTCGWTASPTRILAFIGDQMRDFPTADERIPDTGSDSEFGRTCFLLPNPMYGDWTATVTRMAPSPQR
jgi:5'-nucleotidase (lipoprotein e(P4) family)